MVENNRMLAACKFAVCFAALASVFISHASLAAQPLPVGPKEPADAVAAAIRYTGFDRSRGYQLLQSAAEIATVQVYRDSVTPYLADSIDGLRAWCVRMENIAYDTVLPRALCPPRTFTVWLDSSRGRLLQITSELADPPYKLYPGPTATEAAYDLATSSEAYLGVPDEYPVIDAITALQMKRRFPNAGKIMMSYVLYSQGGSDAVPAWSIVYKGIRPDMARNRLQEPSFSNWRTVVDARTGLTLASTNYPSSGVEAPRDSTSK